MKTTLAITSLLLLSACSSVPVYKGDDPTPLTIVEADENMVKGCEFLGTVTRSSATTLGGSGLGYAVRAAQNKGGTHYVITQTKSAKFSGINGLGNPIFRGAVFANQRGSSSVRAYGCGDWRAKYVPPKKVVRSSAK